ncbi:hypothetical protein RhiirA1_460560 [Rhizophagus irregularis]|uniref:Uncharacterized protein n=1 Tax=Rhizophagus irregularis TaxID=588596 RepID=A0A2N0RR89_9GLOM|nr:hypothetical protein RhiirA1_460560 [Rhizophagus irregularis]
MELLAYFVNENTLMEAVENSLKNGLEGGKEVEVRDKKQERKVEESMSGINLSSPVTPPNRIYAELPSPGDVSEDSLKKRELKKDNVSPVEVVEIINQQREESKILYKRNDFSTTQNDSGSRLDEKIEKFEKIYKKVGNKMKWEVLGVQMKFVKH